VEEIDKEKARFLNLTDKRIYTIAYDDLELWVTGEALWVTKETSAYLKRNCFLQEKFPHFCKNFSPGTGGEILCQPQQL